MSSRCAREIHPGSAQVMGVSLNGVRRIIDFGSGGKRFSQDVGVIRRVGSGQPRRAGPGQNRSNRASVKPRMIASNFSRAGRKKLPNAFNMFASQSVSERLAVVGFCGAREGATGEVARVGGEAWEPVACIESPTTRKWNGQSLLPPIRSERFRASLLASSMRVGNACDRGQLSRFKRCRPRARRSPGSYRN